MAGRTIGELRDRALRWEETIRADSAMYSRLALHVADSNDLLDLMRAVSPGQLELNMLFAAVQYLLLGDPSHRLAGWYPSLGGTRADGGIELAFDEFVTEHADDIRHLITARRVQTNEVARCAFLLPAYNLVAAMTQAPLAIIEVGTSAGLNQNVDRYGYTYRSESGIRRLNDSSPVQLECDTGRTLPKAATSIPNIAWRIGLDVHPIDVTDPDQARWLRALVWPDQVERHHRLAGAIGVAQDHPPRVVGGDAFDVVETLVEQAPGDAAVVVQHSFVLNQFPTAERERFYQLLDSLAAGRPVYRVAAEWLTRIRHTLLDVTIHGQNRTTIDLGRVHHHGRWMKLTPAADP